MENKPTIEIIIENLEFRQPYNYFITIRLDDNGEKVNLTLIQEKN